ncbi:chemotaxis protein CheC [Nitrososphaera sp.]|uniref:chemotaxis protein CheC n=1 Tax=Nitrososphaera sp. TaxID=1971748 RepID=UPI0017BB303A|nr:chemotaxis protein CheC [Nitrososphaera sp.]NWG37162.1 chemotaxis protein CheC [Nitrososphaera sp.]
MMTSSLNETELKTLKDLLNSYIGRKTKPAFSMILGEEVEYSVRSMNLMHLQDIDGILLPFMNQEMCAIYLRAEGDVRIGMLLFMQESQALSLAAKLLGKDTLDRLDSMGKSSLAEVGNILLAGSVLNAISDSTGFRIDCSVPGFAIESLGAILGDPIAEIAVRTNSLILAGVELYAPKSNVRVYIFLFFGLDDIKKLLAHAKDG